MLYGSVEWQALEDERISRVEEYRSHFVGRDGLVARWETRGGRYWVELRVGQFGYSYESDHSGGSLPDGVHGGIEGVCRTHPAILTDEDAIAWMEPGTRPGWLEWYREQVSLGNRQGVSSFLPDAAKESMRRVA